MRVDEDGAGELLGGTGELREDERAVVVEAARDVLLGHEVHAVAQGGDEHDVGGDEERRHLIARIGVVEVVDGDRADVGLFAVDPADGEFDVVADELVLLEALPRRGGDLDEDDVLDVEPAFGEELPVRLEAVPDALRVVHPVDAEHDDLRVADLLADLGGALDDRRIPRELLEVGGVDRDGERLGADEMRGQFVTGGDGDRRPLRLEAEATAHRAPEVRRIRGPLEADEVGAEEAAEDLVAPRQLREELERRERDVVEEADLQIRAHPAHELRDELELVVVDPHGRGLRRHLGDLGREALIDPHIRIPPRPVVLRRGDDVVVEGPQGGVGKPFVVPEDILICQRHGDEVHAVDVEGLELDVGHTGPADPRPLLRLHHRGHRGDQTSW